MKKTLLFLMGSCLILELQAGAHGPRFKRFNPSYGMQQARCNFLTAIIFSTFVSNRNSHNSLLFSTMLASSTKESDAQNLHKKRALSPSSVTATQFWADDNALEKKQSSQFSENTQVSSDAVILESKQAVILALTIDLSQIPLERDVSDRKVRLHRQFKQSNFSNHLISSDSGSCDLGSTPVKGILNSPRGCQQCRSRTNSNEDGFFWASVSAAPSPVTTVQRKQSTPSIYSSSLSRDGSFYGSVQELRDIEATRSGQIGKQACGTPDAAPSSPATKGED